MLYYSEAGLSRLEVPRETALCIYISGCNNGCENCQYPELQEKTYGDVLKNYYKDLVALYLNFVTAVCFLGEGENTKTEQCELREYAQYAKALGLKTCLYSGRDVSIEAWMSVFDYIKLGSYQPSLGSLYCNKTNQRFYEKTRYGYIDITDYFWK